MGKVDARGFLAVDVVTVGRVVLPAGHADGAVVQEQHGYVAAVVGDVQEALHAHVHEGRIADHGDDLFVLLRFGAALVETMRHAHRCAHRDAGVKRVPRMAGPQRVAADVAGNGDVAQLREGVIDAKVRAGHAHRRRARENGHRCDVGFFRQRFTEQAGNGRFEHIRCQFALARQDVLAGHGDALRLDFGFDQRFDFLDNDQLFALSGELADQGEGQRVGEAQFQNRGLGEALAHVHVGRAGGDEADAPVATGLDEVEL